MDQYPQQQESTSPHTPRRNRTRKWVILLIVAAVLLSGGGILAYVLLQGQNSPTATLQRFCDGYKNHDYQAMYETLSTSNKKIFTSAMVQQVVNSQKGMRVDCVVSNVQQHGDTATGTLAVTSFPAGEADKAPLTRYSTPILVVENGQWKIDRLGS